MRLIYPVLAQVLWTLIVAVMTVRARFAAISKRDVRVSQIALGNDAWPDRVKATGNNFSNQFETPVLFYVLCGAGLYVESHGWLLTLLAWGYVATRVGHTLVHTGSNNVQNRFRVFVAGVAIIAAMLVVVTVKALKG